MVSEMKKIVCGKCNTTFDHEQFYLGNGKAMFPRKYCDPCSELVAASERYDAQQLDEIQREVEFALLCPPEYQKKNFNATVYPNRQKLADVSSYHLTQRGLLLSGPSRAGKTRAMWLMLHALFVVGAVKMQAMSEVEFADKCERASQTRTIDSLLDRLRRSPVFFIDDIGHANIDKKYLTRLWNIVEYRTSNRLPIMATTQFTSAELADNSSKIIGGDKTIQAIINRLKEFCIHISFNSPTHEK